MSDILLYNDPSIFAVKPDQIEFKIIFTGTTIYNLRVGNASLQDIHEVRWDMGDGNVLTTKNGAFSYTYTGEFVEPAVKEIVCTVQPVRHIERKFELLYIYGNNTTTQINKISSIEFINMTDVIVLYIYNTTVEKLDLSAFEKLSGNISLDSNTSLTSITFPSAITATNNITNFYCYSNPQLTTLNLSVFNKLSGYIYLYSNTSLTGITFPSAITATNDITNFYCYNNPQLTTLDLSVLTHFRRSNSTSTVYAFDCSNCAGLTTIQYPQVSTGVSTHMCFSNFIYLNDCALDQASVDGLFAELLRYYGVITPVGNVTVNIGSGTNSPPSAQGLADIGSLETIFTNAGKTITITKNI